jgi:hypothetical protein
MVLSDGPSLYWRELGGTASVTDVSPKHNDGTVTGCVESAQGSTGTAIRLCGGYLYAADIFDFADTAPFTFEAWIRPIDVQLAEFARIAGKENPVSGPRQGWDLIAIGWQADGGVPALAFERWHATDGSEAASGAKLVNPTLPPATFTHIAVTYDSARCRIYLNGVSAADESSTGPLPDTTGTFRVGASPFGSNWLGDIAEIAVYEKTLPANRVAAHYDQGKAAGY